MSERPKLDLVFSRIFKDQEGKELGSGWVSGTVAVFLGSVGLLAVIVFHFPELLSWQQLRVLYPLDLVRAFLELVIGVAFLLGVISAVLRQRKVLGFVAMGLALAASLLGGANVEIAGEVRGGIGLGLDWFLLDVIFLAIIFVPLERLFPKHAEQSVFRTGWTTDMLYFFTSHLLAQVVTLATLAPAQVFFSLVAIAPVQAFIGGLPFLVQFFLVVLTTDLGEYSIHRLFHRVSFLWRFHAIHHSSESLDWLAGSRLHIVDVIVTRAFTFVPIFWLGYSQIAVYSYLVFVSFHAVFIHANVRFDFGFIENFIATPRFHHWHHAAQREAIDKNFAIHFPFIDRLFGTAFFPKGLWPKRYGIHGQKVPSGFLAQLVAPLGIKLRKPDI